MTTLVSWIARDQRRATAIYFASDSRITWGSEHRRWDAGRKLFGCKTSPDIFGYSGDVVFPCLCLSQIIDAVDNGLLFDGNVTPDHRNDIIFIAIQTSFERRHNVVEQDFSIFHAYRSNIGRHSQFHFWRINYNAKNDSWARTKIDIGSETQIVDTAGSGRVAAKQQADIWLAQSGPGRSRSIFSGFCDAIDQKRDPLSGGAPQLVGLYLKDAARNFGVLYQDQTYLYGLPVAPNLYSKNLEWRDRLFQRIDGSTLAVITGARRHARPKQLDFAWTVPPD